MQARVAGAVQVAAEPVRATLPVRFTVYGNAISLNNSKANFVRDGKVRTVNVTEYKEWKEMLRSEIAKQWGIMLPYEQEVFVIYDIYRIDNRADYANCGKALDDALEAAGVLKNDRLIRRGTLTKFVDKHRPRVEIHIYPSTLQPL